MTRDQAFNPIRALESTWQILMKAPLPMWVGGLLLVVVQSMGSFGGNVNVNEHTGPQDLVWIFPMIGLSLLMGIVVLAAVSWISVGYYLAIRDVMRTGNAEFEDVIKPRGRWMQMFLTRLLQLLLYMLAFLPFAIPPTIAMMLSEGLGAEDGIAVAVGVLGVIAYIPVLIYVGTGLLFMPYAAALDDMSPTESIGRSWEIASGYRWNLILFVILSWLMALVGLMLCCVGIIPAGIMIEIMWCESYIQATDIVGDPNKWWIEGATSHSRRYGRGGEQRDSGSTAKDTARDVEAQAAAATSEPREVEPLSDEPFDPGRWRSEADIPPIDETDEGNPA